MSVNPGFGNQSFLPSTFNKLREVRKIIDANFSDILLEVDGGVKLDNIADIACAGANVFVMGSGLFKYSNYKLVIEKIRKKLEYAHSRSIH